MGLRFNVVALYIILAGLGSAALNSCENRASCAVGPFGMATLVDDWSTAFLRLLVIISGSVYV